MKRPVEFLEPADVGRLASLTPARVRSLANAGVIPVAAVTVRGSRLFDAAAVKRFVRGRRKLGSLRTRKA